MIKILYNISVTQVLGLLVAMTIIPKIKAPEARNL